MPQIPIGLRRMIFGVGLVLGGCDPGHKEAVRDKKADDPMSWSSSPIAHDDKDEAAAADKGGIFGGKRLQGGLDDTSRDIEKSLGVH